MKNQRSLMSAWVEMMSELDIWEVGVEGFEEKIHFSLGMSQRKED
jgi:hypothetical protein